MTADMVAAVLRFFSEVSSDVMMKDWLGGVDGNIFWPVLLTMLCNTPLHTPVSLNVFPHKYEVIFPMFNPFPAFHENCHLLSLLPGRVVQSVTCLATDVSLTADPGVRSSIPARSHTFM